jgi:acetylglutamate kinase
MLLLKAGGGEKINWDYIALDLKEILKKETVILLHGANKVRDKIAKKLKYPTKIIVSPSGIPSVLTDNKAIDIFLMTYAGLVNKRIVEKLQGYQINAVGLCGVDGRLFEGKRKKAILASYGQKIKVINNTYTGKIEKFNSHLIKILIQSGYTPVITPPGISDENKIINFDSDLVLSLIAKELNIKKIVVLFEEKGLLKDFNDKKSLIKKIDKNKLDNFLKYAQDRMKKKILGIKKVFQETKVEKVFFGDGTIKNPIFKALKGVGTVIC